MVGGIGGGGPSGPGKLDGATGPLTPASGPSRSGATEGAGARFGETLGVRSAEQADGASPLARLRSGELDLPGYVDQRVREATSHLEGLLTPGDLARIQAELRDVIESDPDVAALVKAAETAR
jgi:hypothetical protein